MKPGHLELFVKDPQLSKAFYVDVLGFALVVEQPGGNVWVQCGDLEILLRPGSNAHPAPDYQHAPSALVLYTPDLPGTAAALRERGLVFRGTDGQPDCLTFTDPDGHWFQLVNPDHA